MNQIQIDNIKTILNNCKINITSLHELENMIIPREILINNEIYESLNDDIKNLKKIFNSSFLNCLHSNAKDNQKWPLLNLIRQILKSCQFKMTPKRISSGYTKDGKKIFKRVFIVERILKKNNIYDVSLCDVNNNETEIKTICM